MDFPILHLSNIIIQDAGACLTIMHIRVYYKYCPQTIHNLAEYERTNAGASSSPAAAQGRCVANAIQVLIGESKCTSIFDLLLCVRARALTK